jgi:HK97 gp10 family phage protein
MKNEAKVTIDTSEFEKELAAFINESALDIAKQVAKDAKASVNVVTGNLKKSIRAKKSKFEDGGAIVQASAPHSHLVEFGHGGPKPAPPHPFLRPALEKNITEARRQFGAK